MDDDYANIIYPFGYDYGHYKVTRKDLKLEHKCSHEFVNMGFMFRKMVCKLCDQEKKDET